MPDVAVARSATGLGNPECAPDGDPWNACTCKPLRLNHWGNLGFFSKKKTNRILSTALPQNDVSWKEVHQILWVRFLFAPTKWLPPLPKKLLLEAARQQSSSMPWVSPNTASLNVCIPPMRAGHCLDSLFCSLVKLLRGLHHS